MAVRSQAGSAGSGIETKHSMAKLFVVESDGDSRVPFLRGILTRSLQRAGLGFEEAYQYASQVRDELSEESEIWSWELRRLVAEHLRNIGHQEIAQHYANGSVAAKTLQVLGEEGNLESFSVDTHSKSLELCGIETEDARSLSRSLSSHLAQRGRTEISRSYLGRLTYRMLSRETDKKTAHRYLVWRQFKRSGMPLLLLVGGTAGSGKSTMATELASRLDIFRTQSTDMLREIMRAMLPERLLPILHLSSFEAWRALPDTADPMSFDDKVAHGYHGQTDLVSVLCEAAVQRAVRENVSMVLEGVHIDATTVKRLRENNNVIVVPVMLAVVKQEVWRKRICGRSKSSTQRRAQRYIKNFQTIWQLQSQLLSEADSEEISIVVNEERERTIGEVLRIIANILSERFKSPPNKVFPGHE